MLVVGTRLTSRGERAGQEASLDVHFDLGVLQDMRGSPFLCAIEVARLTFNSQESVGGVGPRYVRKGGFVELARLASSERAGLVAVVGRSLAQ